MLIMAQIFLFSIVLFSLSVSDAFPCQSGQFMPPNMPQNGMGGYGGAGGGGCPYQQQPASPYGQGMGPNMNSGPVMNMSPGFPGAYGSQFPQGPGAAAGQYPGFAGQNSVGYGAGQTPSNEVRCFKVLPNGQMVPIDPSLAADELSSLASKNAEEERKRLEAAKRQCLANIEAEEIKLRAKEDAKIITDAAQQRSSEVVVAAAQKGEGEAAALTVDAVVAPAADVVAADTNPNVTNEGVQIITVA